jgi:hypothetical protein
MLHNPFFPTRHLIFKLRIAFAGCMAGRILNRWQDCGRAALSKSERFPSDGWHQLGVAFALSSASRARDEGTSGASVTIISALRNAALLLPILSWLSFQETWMPRDWAAPSNVSWLLILSHRRPSPPYPPILSQYRPPRLTRGHSGT